MSVSAHPQLTRPEAMNLACRLRAAGASTCEIQRDLALHGVVIKSTETIVRWTDPEYAERKRVEKRIRERERLRRRHPEWRLRTVTDADRYQRLADLRRAGLSQEATAKVLRLDFGVHLTRHDVTKAERKGCWPLKGGADVR